MTSKPRAGTDDPFAPPRAIDEAGETLLPPTPKDGGGDPPDGGADNVAELWLDPKAPLEIAQRFVARRHTEGACPTIWHYRDDFHVYAHGAWARAPDQDVRNALYLWIATGFKPGKEGRGLRCHPNARFVSNVIDALKAVVPLPAVIDPPCWLPNDDPEVAAMLAEQPPASEFLATVNGLLHVNDRLFGPSTPSYFSTAVIPVPYSETAPPPAAWLLFLAQLFPDDPQAVETIQEWFGYVLTGATRLQKILLIVGPPRSGKSTIAKILTALIGAGNVVSPAFSVFGDRFALEVLIDKSLVIVGDARIGRASDQAAITENLLGISGEDDRTVPRKHQGAWTGRLKSRFMLISNELPRLSDASGALASRIVLLTITQSFSDREDSGLADRLLREMPSILSWSLDGWDRLNKRGRFVQPESGRDALRTLRDLGSEMHAFIRDRCALGRDHYVSTDDLYAAFIAYRTEAGFEGRINQINFGRNLRAACPTVQISQPRGATGRLRVYTGITLRETATELPLDQAPSP